MATRVILPSATRTQSGTAEFAEHKADRLQVQLDVTAATGETPTLDVTVEDTLDGENWNTVATFTQATGATKEIETISALYAEQLRVKWTMAGGAANASLSTNLTGDNNDLVFTAADEDLDGNDVSITYVDPGAGNEELSIEANGRDIVVTLATGDPVAAALTTALAGDDNDVTFTAVETGADGNNITVAYVDPEANDSGANVVVDGTDIVINLGTDDEGEILTTATHIVNLITQSSAASALVTAELATENDGTGVVIAMTETGLADGAAHAVTSTADELKTAWAASEDDLDEIATVADKADNDGTGTLTAMARTNLSNGASFTFSVVAAGR